MDGGTAKCPIDQYRFPIQDIQVRRGDDVETRNGKFGDVHAIDMGARTIDVKLGRKVLYELDGGDREKVKKLEIEVEPGAIEVCVPVAS